MKTIHTLQALRLCAQYTRLAPAKREALQRERLQKIVTWARAQSPYYASLYRGIPDNFRLSDLPPVQKPDLMAHWNDWVTDRSLRLADVEAFMTDPDHIGRKFAGHYLVFTTSGSTGNPLVMLCDETTQHMMGAINLLRAITRKEDWRALILRSGRTIGVFATGGFYLGNSSTRARLLQMPWKKHQLAVTSALLPTEAIVRELNAFQPAMLGGYPSSLALLVDEQQKGNLHIHPVLIMTGGETMTDDVRLSLSKAFGCYTQTTYSCTEGGTIACECPLQHLHLNDDWVLVEPVDQENRPVPDGTQSDHLLMTNLFNFTQPFIRYALSDRVTLHREPCGCGNPSPWLTLEGRADDVLTFAAGNRSIKVAPLPLYATLREVKALRRFQIVSRPGNRLELRLTPAPGVTAEDAFHPAKAALETYLQKQGIMDVQITLSSQLPCAQPGSGKFKHILRLDA